MKKIHCDLGERSYDIRVGHGVIGALPSVIRSLSSTAPVVVICDRTVRTVARKTIAPVFGRIENRLIWVTVPGEEKSKSMAVYQRVMETVSRRTKMHRPVIVAMGGGVVGDLAGFVAATYRRGVPLVQVPTTLLAQVDSSIGGKVGIDLPHAKNLVGAFKQPAAVLADTGFLRTLPLRQLHNGLAEVIKYGIIKDRALFSFLEKNRRQVISLDRKTLEHVICRCARIKAGVVARDEFDRKDVRIILNFGHTIGHAVEAASGYSALYNHGESISIGMTAAGDIARELGMLPENELERIKKLIGSYGLPVRAKGLARTRVMEAYRHDKKFTGGCNRFVLPRRIGSVETVEDIPEILVRAIIRKYAAQ